MAQVVYFDAVQKIVDGAILLVVAVFLMWTLWRVWRWHRRDPDNDTPLILGFPLALLIFFLLVIALYYLADIWNWIAVFGDPRLYLLHKQFLGQCSGHSAG